MGLKMVSQFWNSPAEADPALLYSDGLGILSRRGLNKEKA
jgi:hypothetical protein